MLVQDRRNVQSKKAKKAGIRFGRILAKSAAILTAAAFLSFNSASAAEDIETIYHVYLGETKIGTVDEQSVINGVVEEKAEALQEKYPELELSSGNQLTIVPEKTYRAQFNNETVEKALEESLAVKASAYAIKVGDEIVGYVKDEKAAKEVIRQLKLQFVSEEELKTYEAVQNGETDASESSIKDIRFSIEPNIEKGFSSPGDLLTVEEALQRIKNGKHIEQTHSIKENEVLLTIAEQYDLSLKQLLMLNPEVTEDSLLHIDDKVNVTVKAPYINVIVEKETDVKEKIPHKVKVVKDEDMYKGDTKVKQEGSDGEKKIRYRLVEVNGKNTEKEVLSEETVKEKKDEIVVKGTKVMPSRGTGTFTWPAVGGTVTSKMGTRWGRQHKGIDIAGVSDRTIKAADNGKVVFAGNSGAYGNKVVIDHNNGYRTLYGHLNSISVKVGDTVQRGGKIGVMGTTGRSTGVHLHFEVTKNGALKNPLDFF